MPAERLNGVDLAKQLKEQIARATRGLTRLGRPPHLVAIHGGDDPAAVLYAERQKKACEDLGITYRLDRFGTEVTEAELLDRIQQCNQDEAVSGLILLLPLPDSIAVDTLQEAIAPHKDLEGMNPANLGRLVSGRKAVAPCTPLGAVALLAATGIHLREKHAVIVGASTIVGKPLALLLMDKVASVTVCRTSEPDLPSRTRKADILIAATGKPGLITADMVKPGAVVIDVGINRVPAYDADGQPILKDHGKPKMKTVGDVDFESVAEVASAISPVPGGTGPMTVAMLLRNALEAATPV